MVLPSTLRRVCHRLTGCHHRVEDGQGLSARNFRISAALRVSRAVRHVWSQAGDEEQRSRFLAVVAIVTHVEGLSKQGPDIYAFTLQGRMQGWAHHIVHPVQALQHFFA